MRRTFRKLFPISGVVGGDRRLVWLVWAVGVLQGFGQAPLSTLLPYTRVGLGLSEGQMSLVLSITRFASLAAIGFSWWGDRAGRRRPFLAAITILMVGSGFTALTSSPVAFTAGQSAVRVATGATGTLAAVLIAERLSPDLRAFGIGLYAAAGSLGAGLGQLMVPVAATGPGMWRLGFAAPALGLLALPWLSKIEESPLVAEPEHVPIAALATGRLARAFWVAGIAALCASAFPAVALAFTNEHLIADVGLAPGQAVTLALVAGTIGGMGFWVGGRLADVWGRRPTTILSLVLATTGGLWLFASTTVPSLFLAIMIGGFGSFAYVPAAASHRTELFPTRLRATAGAAGAYLATLGSALGLLVGRLTIDRIGLTRTMLVLSAAMAVSAILTMFLPETRGQDLEKAGT